MKERTSEITEPRNYLYHVCYKKKDGQEKVICESVSIKKGLKAIKNYKRLLDAGASIADEIQYVYLIPLI